MFPRLMGWVWRALGLTFLVVTVLAGAGALDAATEPPAAGFSEAHDAPKIATRAPRRMFVLLIDSLRYQTATNPAFMPHLVDLAARGTSARVTPTRDAVTVPCVRAAFTGEDRTRVLGFLANFVKHKPPTASLFGDLAAAGGHAAAYSDNAFDAFEAGSFDRL